MKKNIIILGLFIASMGVTNCNSGKENTASNHTIQSGGSPSSTTANKLQIDKIDKLRFEIESFDIKPVEVVSTNFREKTKQKWSKIHFYVKDNEVIRVKTYPYAEISKRTEEFYVDKGDLKLVVIEDNGEGGKGKPKNEIDKMYYFESGKLIKELNNQKETELTIKESDAEELLSEFQEYIQIYNQTRK